MISLLLSLLSLPLLLLISLPLFLFSLLTTTLAFTTLIIHSILIYANLFFLLLSPTRIGAFNTARAIRTATITSSSSPTNPNHAHKPRLHRRRTHSSSSHKPSPISTPRPLSYSGLGIYTSTPGAAGQRDFEGLGGWRHAEDEDPSSDERWTRMNSRLELPAAAAMIDTTSPIAAGSAGGGSGGGGGGGGELKSQRHHGRSLTGGHLGLGVAMQRRSPARSRTRASKRGMEAFREGEAGRERAGVGRRMGWSKSTTDLGSGVGGGVR